MAQTQVSMESLSPTPINEDVIKPVEPTIGDTEGEAAPVEAAATETPAPISQVEKQEIMQPTEGVYPSQVAEQQRVEQLREQLTANAVPPKDSINPAVPPAAYSTREAQLRKEGKWTREAKDGLVRDTSAFYRNNILNRNLPEDGEVAGRLNALNSASYFRTYKVDQDGNVLKDARGKEMYSQVPLQGSEDFRLIQMFERGDQAKYDSGVYEFFDADNNSMGVVDIGLQKQRRQLQNPVAAWFYRTETEEGGMQHYIDGMKKANPNISPARLSYYAQKQAEAGAFSGIEGQRTWGNIKDTVGFFQEIGGGAFSWVGGELEALGDAYNYLTGTPTEDITEASKNVIAKTVIDNSAVPTTTDSDIEAAFDRVMDGDLSPLDIQDSLEAFKEANPGVNENELAFHYMYSPDAAAQIKRFTTESALTGAGFVSITKKMAKTERNDFMNFVREKTGNTEFTDVGGALKAVQDSEFSTTDLLSLWRNERGSKKWFSDFRARTLDYELNKGSVYRDDIIQPEINRKKSVLDEINTKLEEATKKGDRPQTVAALTARKRVAEKDLHELTRKRYIPPHLRNFFVDETIANTAAAIGYQAIYDATGYNETAASIGAFVSAITASTSRARLGFADTMDDFKSLWKYGVYGEGAATNKAAKKFVRTLRNSPPELREQQLIFLERKAVAQEELAEVRYPDNYPKVELRGKPIVDEDILSEGYFQMSGMLSLQAINAEIRKSNIDIQKDVGGLNQKLWELERSYLKEKKMMSYMAKHMDALKYYKMSDKYNPDTESGRMVDTLVGFYDNNKKRLDDLEKDFADYEKKTTNDIMSFFDGSRGKLTPDVKEGLENREIELGNLLDVAWERHKAYNLPEDMDVTQELNASQEFFNGLQEKINKAFAQNAEFTFDDKQGVVANNLFRDFLVVQRARANAEGNAAYRGLRNSPLYKDARMDITDVADMLINDASDTLVFDERGFSELIKAYSKNEDFGEPIESLSLLKFAGKDVGSRNSMALRRMFNESANRYLNFLDENDFGDDLARVLEDAEIDESASALEKFYAWRNWFKNEGAAEFGEELVTNLEPRLGVGVTDFTHLISGLGGSKSNAAHELRKRLLTRAESEFYNDFYMPLDQRSPVEGFAEDYKNVRDVWSSRVSIWTDKDAKVKKLSADPDKRILDNNAFDSFMKNTLIGKRGITRNELNEPGGFIYEVEQLTGQKLDITTETGKAVRDMLTSYAMAELARTPGAMALRDYVVKNGDELVVKSISGRDVIPLAEKLAGGTSATPILDNLTRLDPTTGKPLLVDVNGQPLIDPKVHRLLGIDHLMSYDVVEAVNAVKRIDTDLKAISDRRLVELKDANSDIRRELQARKDIAVKIGNNPDGMGAQLITIATSELGADNLAKLRGDYIRAKVAEGVPEGEAAAYWQQTVRDATIERLMNANMAYSGEMVSRAKNVDDMDRTQIEEVQSIDVKNLAKMLGMRGETAEMGKQERAMRSLLGDETYDHMKMVVKTLYQPDVSTGPLQVTGTSMPLSAESLLSRGTSFFRGVISLRWLISEAAIRKSRQSNYELTKLMLSSPEVGKEIMDIVINQRYDFNKRQPEFVDMLLSQIAKNDAIQRYASESYTPVYMESTLREEEQQRKEQEQLLEQMQQREGYNPQGA